MSILVTINYQPQSFIRKATILKSYDRMLSLNLHLIQVTINIMTLSASEKKQYRAIAHNLNPVIIIGDKGLTEGLMIELERALHDHELLKIKIAIGDREDRSKIIEELVYRTGADLVQSIGKVAVLLKKSPKPHPKLSNLLRA